MRSRYQSRNHYSGLTCQSTTAIAMPNIGMLTAPRVLISAVKGMYTLTMHPRSAAQRERTMSESAWCLLALKSKGPFLHDKDSESTAESVFVSLDATGAAA